MLPSFMTASVRWSHKRLVINCTRCEAISLLASSFGKRIVRRMAPTDPVTLIAPLSLSNVLTTLCALFCLWTASPQASGGVWRLWRLATPGGFAAVVSLMLLAGIFDSTWQHDAEWVVALLLGGLAGRTRGWTMPVEIDQRSGLVRLPRTKDGVIAAAGVVAMAALDFSAAALDEVLLEPQHIAAGSALFASFLACRALAIIVRCSRATHMRSRDVA
jgi:hypothetical protein